MMDPFEKTVCDRIVKQQANEAKESEHSIILTIIAGNEIDFGKRFILENDRAGIGREVGNDIPLNDGKTSKFHCEISILRSGKSIDQIIIKDLASTNGILVNGKPVIQATLKAGDKIQVGDTLLQLNYSDAIEKEYHAKLFNFAARDALTGLFNKRFIINELENHFRIARRSHRPFSIIMIDIDDFKQINDRYGHQAGDDYLKQLAVLFVSSLRDQDIIGRIGGEEFLAILPETALDGALQLAIRIRQNIEEFVLHLHDAAIRTTISSGVSQYEAKFTDVKEFLDLADQALYEAKKSGKNKVMQALLTDLDKK
jgi:diguanylate cyclase (GGDEF)-like protein